MGRGVLSEVKYASVASTAKKAGSATFRGEQRQREGKGLHPLVDPSGYEVIRRSISWLEPKNGYFELLRGVAMLEETRLDTTGSMGNNVEIAMRVLPATYKLLATGPNAVLKRYDTQMITAIFGDVSDNYVLCRSQAEMDERIAEQMTLMLPERDGGDTPEDPQYGLFGGAFLTWASINQYGLKYYDFTVSDAPGRLIVDPSTLVRVFGNSVFEKAIENGYQIDRKNVPNTKEVVAELLKRAHAFFLQVNNASETTRFWSDVFGTERIIQISKTELLPQVKAAIIGLTEGVLDLQSIEEFLTDGGKVNAREAKSIKQALSDIPIGAQAALPNFDKLPLKGAKFANKNDIWPMEDKPSSKKAKAEKPKKGDMWL